MILNHHNNMPPCHQYVTFKKTQYLENISHDM